jgi:uncharacterized protein YjbI with pentapeptide repeats
VKKTRITRAELRRLGITDASSKIVREHARFDEYGIFDPAATAEAVRASASHFEEQVDQARRFKSAWGARSYDEFTDLHGQNLRSLELRRTAARELDAVEPPPSPPFDERGYEAHLAWLSSGKKGAGRLYLRGQAPELSFEGRNLEGAIFHGCDLREAVFSGAILDEVELEGCDLRRARFDVDAPTFGRANGARGARFVGCDLRGARLSNLKLDHTTFSTCKLHGVAGQPWIEGPYTVESPDFSVEGDGSDVRSGEAVKKDWQR